MQNTDWVSKSTYYLGTGPLEYFYTLWKEVRIKSVPGTNIGGLYCYYLGNLSHTYDEAVAKATAKTGQTEWETFDVTKVKRVNSSVPDLDKSPEEIKFTFGKYNTRTLDSVLEEDLGYVLYLALKSDWEPSQAKHGRVLNYIRAMFRQQAQEEEDAKQARIAAERAARDANRADLPVFEGRVTLQGKVISTKVVEGPYGSQPKMLVESAQGWKVWGSIPASIAYNLKKGDIVRFDAKVQKSDKDPKFGFFSRATKAVIIESVPEPDLLSPNPSKYSSGGSHDNFGFGGNHDAN